MPRPLSSTLSQPLSSSDDLDEGRMAGDRLVHRVVDHLGEEMMQRVGVGAADIHARAAAHRLEPLQHLDRGGVVVGLAGGPVAQREPWLSQGRACRVGSARRRKDHSCRFHKDSDSFGRKDSTARGRTKCEHRSVRG